MQTLCEPCGGWRFSISCRSLTAGPTFRRHIGRAIRPAQTYKPDAARQNQRKLRSSVCTQSTRVYTMEVHSRENNCHTRVSKHNVAERRVTICCDSSDCMQKVQTCCYQALPLDDSKAAHTTVVSIQTVLLEMSLTPAADSLHLAAIFRLPANAWRVLCMDSSPTLFIELSPGPVGHLIMAQSSPVFAGRTDAAQIFRR